MAHLLLSMVILVAAGALVLARAAGVRTPGERAGDLAVARARRGRCSRSAVVTIARRHRRDRGRPARGRLGDRATSSSGWTSRARTRVGWLVNRHGALAALLGLLAIGVWCVARRRGADAALVHRLARVCLLMAVQGVLGIVQFQLEVPAEMVWVHVALATLLWVGIVLAAVQAGSPLAVRRAVGGRGPGQARLDVLVVVALVVVVVVVGRGFVGRGFVALGLVVGLALVVLAHGVADAVDVRSGSLHVTGLPVLAAGVELRGELGQRAGEVLAHEVGGARRGRAPRARR